MSRLTQKDEQGNWCLKGLAWEKLYVGQVITQEMSEMLYGALWKLMEYEDTGLKPGEVESLNTFDSSQAVRATALLQEEQRKHRWIPVEERLPEGGEEVQVTVSRGYVDIGYYDESREEWWASDDAGLMDVIAWKPMPESYQPAD